jgi:hypothetical protein
MAAIQTETSNCPGGVLTEGISSFVISMTVLGHPFLLFLFEHKTFLLIIKTQ